MHTFSVHASVPQSQSSRSNTQQSTPLCVHIQTSQQHIPAHKAPLPCTPAATVGTTQGTGAALPTGKTLPLHCTPTMDPDLAGGIRECFPDTPQSIGLPQRALHPPHPPTLLSTPVIRGRKRALGLDNFVKRPELVHPHITSPCNSSVPPLLA